MSPMRSSRRTVAEVALGLVDLGIEPGDRVSILSHTRPEWTYACFATFAVGAVAVSIYQTNSAEECRYVLGHSGSRAVFVEDAEQLAKIRAVAGELPALEFVIVMQPADVDGGAVSLAALRERGRRREAGELEQRRAAISPQDDCLFIYTSGTTGPPKACELTHGNYRAVTSAVQARGVVHEDDLVYLFLPLAHALALVIQFVVLDLGATLAYWEKDPQKIVANLMELRPTFFPSVPRIFEKIHTLATTTGDREQIEQATRGRIGGAPRARARRAGVRAAAGGVRPRRAGRVCQRAQPVRWAPAPGGDRSGTDRPRDPRVLLRLRRAGHGGLRPHRDRQRRDRQHPRRVPVGIRRPAAARRRGPHRRQWRDPDQGPQHLQRLLPRPAGDPRGAGRRVAAHAAISDESTTTASSTSPAARRTSSSPPAARTSRPPTSRTASCKAAGSRTRS